MYSYTRHINLITRFIELDALPMSALSPEDSTEAMLHDKKHGKSFTDTSRKAQSRGLLRQKHRPRNILLEIVMHKHYVRQRWVNNATLLSVTV